MEQKELLKRMWTWAMNEQPNLKEIAFLENDKEAINYYEHKGAHTGETDWDTVCGDYYQLIEPELESEILLLDTEEISNAFDHSVTFEDFISSLSKSWYNNGVENKQFFIVPNGWEKGRIFKNKPGCPKGTKLNISDDERAARAKRRAERNITNPNHSWLGKHHTEEQKEKIRQAHLGLSAWNKGISPSQESINKMKDSKAKRNEQNQNRINELRNKGYVTSEDAAEIIGCGVTTFERFYRGKHTKVVGKKLLWDKSICDNSPLKNMKAKGTSHYENEIAGFLKENNISFTQNDRSKIKHYELDFFVEDYNLAIEFDGLYWHSEEKKENDYHLKKTIACENQDIRLMHIFEDEWNFKKDIVKSMILAACGKFERKIFARNCEVRKIDKNEALNFIKKNHIQDTNKSFKYNYGLFYNDELIQVCTFRKNFAQRKNKDVELARMCSKLNTQVLGGFSKLIKFSMNDMNIDKIASFVDRRIFDAKGYTSSGWKVVGESAPKYFYTDFIIRENRQKYMKQSCLKIWPESDKNKTEKELCNEHNLYQIFDCGCIKVEYTI